MLRTTAFSSLSNRLLAINSVSVKTSLFCPRSLRPFLCSLLFTSIFSWHLNSSCFYRSFHSLHDSLPFMQKSVFSLQLLCLWQPAVSIVMRASVPSHFSCDQLSATLWTVAQQASLPVKFHRQAHWSGLPRPPPGGPPTRGLNRLLLQRPHCKRGSPHSLLDVKFFSFALTRMYSIS